MLFRYDNMLMYFDFFPVPFFLIKYLYIFTLNFGNWYAFICCRPILYWKQWFAVWDLHLQFLLAIFWGHNKHQHFPVVLAGCLQFILYGRLAQQVATEYSVIYSERHKTSCRDDETIIAVKNGNDANHVNREL